ncbi:glyoxylase-like metal-dependent hydrolase (beta-lactamase superfamily II) [Novosphingobium fluoreni]|uniref:Glyoxylase-like metal-dependent hydrolase (Beta-lactamase superfamily II) n=1 Tax=Novosphingobium fluoreni TaxID=1391222 RepID=A0A7W6C0Y2_9SPHN|nr:MBL fold metallo-hydrolase [Novosphingobium fluoreni]MBB3941468.1 glyoxylase-like metal-dependent hydrolase (beta-lactamase superfamily II) [Novosphingobium fluoreni]
MSIGKTLIAAAVLAATAASAQDAPAWPQAPGYYRMQLGDFRVTVLSDGAVDRDLPAIMSDPDTVRARYQAQHQALPARLSINCYLIDTGEHRILVDTGAGELFGNGVAGHLVANLRSAGYAPEDIDTVLLTHIHGDHSGGLSIAGQRLFPNATAYVDAADPALWLSKAQEAAAPVARRATFGQSQKTVGPYVVAGRLKTFTAPATLFPGVRAIPLRGHTPGQSGYVIESQGQRLLLSGDVIHSAEVQFRDPAVTIHYDVDPKAAAATREAILAETAANGILVGGAHIAFPGLGHVTRETKGYSWVPLPWSSQP